jgi:tungstate transport system ATP-binding protein
MAEALLALKDLLVQYGEVPVLRISELAVHAGEILAIIGPNGAGKSTLLRVMGLLQRPARGAIYFRGEQVTRNHALAFRRCMASVFQAPLLLNASVYDNVALGLRLRGLDRRTVAQRVEPWLERLNIAHLRKRQVRSLSGGEAQRTSLARALALDPSLLLLDEPFSALDPPSREALLLELEFILRDTGMTAVFVTHERGEALMLGDRVVVLFGGEIVQQGTPWQVFSQPATEAVARFVGADINLPGTVAAANQGMVQIATPVGAVEVPADLPCGTRVTLCLRPEDLTVHRTDHVLPPSSARNLVRGTLSRITPWGAQARVTIDCGMPLVALVTRRSVEELGLVPGLPVLVTFKASAVHLIRHHGGKI